MPRSVKAVSRAGSASWSVTMTSISSGAPTRGTGGGPPDQLGGLGAGPPAGDDDLDVLADGEFVGDVHRVGDHGDGRGAGSVLQVRAGGQGPRGLAGRGASVARHP